jgi:hypothetical protein
VLPEGLGGRSVKVVSLSISDWGEVTSEYAGRRGRIGRAFLEGWDDDNGGREVCPEAFSVSSVLCLSRLSVCVLCARR